MTSQAHACMHTNDDTLAVLAPVIPELRRALHAVAQIGFGCVTIHIEHGQPQRVVFSCSLKRQEGLTNTTDCGNITVDNEI
mgnify:CR=1 FL=1